MIDGIFQLDLTGKRKLQNAVAGLKPGEYAVCIKRNVGTRSQRANRYYWVSIIGSFLEFLREQGDEYTKDEAHELLKKILLPPRNVINHNTGEVIAKLPAHTHTMTTEEFSRYTERAIAWLGQMGVPVPEPIQEFARTA